MGYQKATFYFLTGTGNSYRATTWMEQETRKAKATTQVQPIQSGRPAEEIGRGSTSLVGLVTPTHGFTVPWVMLRFALTLPRRPGTHALVVATRAGTRIGRAFLPGIEGTATYLIALILLLKGYRVQGILGLDMPSNWTALHSGLRLETVDAIIARARVRVTSFMDAILSGRQYYSSWTNLLLGLLLLPISFGYLSLGRFCLAKLFFASDRCTGCGRCAAHCPLGAIKMWGKGKRRRPYWSFRCESTMRCMAYCPTQAIEAGHSWAVILYMITSAPAVTILLNWLTVRFSGLNPLRGGLAEILLEYIYVLLSIYLSYLLFSLLMRIPWINRLFTVTTLTHYYRRYHEPDTTLNELERGKAPSISRDSTALCHAGLEARDNDL
jgi:Pyruvate/2-oxoacid:ferredoxin oxidoreductase delta subunit